MASDGATQKYLRSNPSLSLEESAAAYTSDDFAFECVPADSGKTVMEYSHEMILKSPAAPGTALGWGTGGEAEMGSTERHFEPVDPDPTKGMENNGKPISHGAVLVLAADFTMQEDGSILPTYGLHVKAGTSNDLGMKASDAFIPGALMAWTFRILDVSY